MREGKSQVPQGRDNGFFEPHIDREDTFLPPGEQAEFSALCRLLVDKELTEEQRRRYVELLAKDTASRDEHLHRKATTH